MGRASGGRWPALPSTLLAVAALTAGGAVPRVPAGASGGKGGTHGNGTAPKLAHGGHVVFWECPAKTTELLVAVNTLTLHPGATLDISFIVRNGAATACNYTAPYAGVAPGPTVATLEAGPCGSVGFEIESASHTNVWPGPEVVNCPALGFAQLAPGGTVSGSGTWNQTKPDSRTRVPVGDYTLVVNNKRFSFPLHVVAH